MRGAKHYFVYILASGLGGTLYVGVTNNLARRIWQHRTGTGSQFTAKYDVHRLVYFAQFDDVEQAILTEKRLKRWKRGWKVQLIEEMNPNWDDLSISLV